MFIRKQKYSRSCSAGTLTQPRVTGEEDLVWQVLNAASDVSRFIENEKLRPVRKELEEFRDTVIAVRTAVVPFATNLVFFVISLLFFNVHH
jgi:hypothetical protein